MFRIISCLMLTATLTAGFACPAAADDPHTCYEKSDDAGLAACNRVINSRRYSRSQHATAYINRGQDWYDRRELD